MTLPRLLLLTDRHQLPDGRDLVETVATCATAGLTHVVVRELDLPDAARTDLVRDIAALGVTAISSRTIEPDAAFVQLAAHQPAPAGLRHARSCHSVRAVRQAAADGAVYAVLSPFAATLSKPGYGPSVELTDYAGHSIPVYALGGITPTTARQAVAAGAYGVASMGGVMRADDPAAEVSRLLEAVS